MDRELIECPVCHRELPPEAMVPPEAVDTALLPLLAVNAGHWQPGQPICRECLTRFARLHEKLAATFPQFEQQKLKILPTPLRLDALEEFTGRGVTMAFIDSGFYAHPDLTRPNNRLLKYVNVVERTRASDLTRPQPASWHGMMTSVVAAGNGFLSRGFYRGIASDASLVLVKVGSTSRIRHEEITAGLRWVIRNRERYNIRIVNISCGGDHNRSYLSDELCQAAEDATRAGMVVVAAAGNAGLSEDPQVLPPASAPSVITVGGLDDKNNFDFAQFDLYRSSYGPTIDGLQKPEIIAPGIWIAAPILPNTPTAEQAQLLAQLEAARDDQLADIIRAHPCVDEDLNQAVNLAPYLLRNIIWIKVRDNNIISGHYKHVDGTSFAAPIVSSIVAQMLEARPDLKPHEVKYILVRTARRMPHVETDRQGWGIVNPRIAVQAAQAWKSSPQ